MGYKTAKETTNALVKLAVTKSQLSWFNTFVLGFMAGVFTGFGGLLAVTVGGGLNTAQLGMSAAKLGMGAMFPIGLMLVIVTSAELFTGNAMTLPLGWLAGAVSFKALVKNWSMSYLGNLAGCAAVAYFGTYLCQMLDGEPWNSFILKITYTKMTLGWGVVVLRGIGANWLVCLAVYLSVASEDLGGKLLAIWWPIMTFVTIGYEHSIANMYYLLTGLMYGSPFTFGDFLAYNLIPATLGNTIAAVVFMACIYYFVHLHKQRNQQQQQNQCPDMEMTAGPSASSSSASSASSASHVANGNSGSQKDSHLWRPIPAALLAMP